MSGLSVWVTGARGFIGRHLVRLLAERGHEVCGLGHGLWAEADARRCGVRRWRNGDVRIANLQSLAREQARAPDVVLHLAGGASVGAALATPLEDFGRTVLSSVELLEWVRQESAGTRVIAISSAAVYGDTGAGPLSEQDACRPCSPYGFHKLMAEQLCLSYAASYGVRTVVARLFSVYGSGLQKQLLWDLCSRLAAGQREVYLGGSGAELRDWTDVRDVVRALTLIAESAGEVVSPINVGSGTATPVRRIAELVRTAWPGVASVTFDGVSRPGDPFSLVADASRLSDCGFKWTISVEQGIADYVNWFRSHIARVS